MSTYVCKLSPELQKQTRDELHEIPEKRDQALVLIRDWINKQRYLNAPTDDWTILRYLRGCKFSIEKTKKKIELHYTLRTALPEWFKNRDPTEPKIVAVLKRGMILPLGRDSQNRYWILSRADELPANDSDIHDMMKASYMVIDIMCHEDEIAWITGTCNVIDLKNYTAAHFLMYTPPLMKKMMVMWQDGYPMRPKGLHYFNTSGMFDKFFSVFKPLMNEKMKRRINMHGSNIENLHKSVEPALLPKELGGTNGTYESLTLECCEKVMSYRTWLVESESFVVDESRRPGKPKTNTDLFGMEGSFTKINVD